MAEPRIPKLYQVMGYIALGIATLAIIGISYEPTVGTLCAAGLVALLMGGMGLPSLMYYNNHKLTFNERRIYIVSWRGHRTHVLWQEIEDLKFSASLSVLTFKAQGEKISINIHLTGMKTFLQTLEENTRWKVEDLNLSKRL